MANSPSNDLLHKELPRPNLMFSLISHKNDGDTLYHKKILIEATLLYAFILFKRQKNARKGTLKCTLCSNETVECIYQIYLGLEIK